MSILDWVLGAVFRPAATYEYARDHLRFGYWWIVLSVFTLEIVIGLYSPANRDFDSGRVLLYGITMLMLLFDLYGLLLFGAGKAFGWHLTWPEALKLIGLTWSVRFLEDVVIFYPTLRELHSVVLWASVPFTLWHLLSLTVGVRSAYRLPTWKALLIGLITILPLRLAEVWLYWSSLAKGS